MVILARSWNDTSASDRLNFVNKSLLKFINVLVDALIVFFRIEDQIRNERDLKRELLFNLVTNLTLDSEVYFLIFNLTSLSEEDNIIILKRIMGNRAFLENHLPMSELNIANQFQFDVNYRNKFRRCKTGEMYTVPQPFNLSIQNLIEISKLESPITKLELFYNVCTSRVTEEIQLFWKNFELPKKHLHMDTEQVQSIILYLISRLNYP